MNSYSDLDIDGIYLIREKEKGDIALVQAMMETNFCVFLLCHADIEKTYWRKKTDPISEIIEELTEDQVSEYENLWGKDEEKGTSNWFENDNP